MESLLEFTNTIWFAPFVLWSLIWKGFSLWRAGRNNQPGWFVAILLLSTAGLLPIVYLALFQKKQTSK